MRALAVELGTSGNVHYCGIKLKPYVGIHNDLYYDLINVVKALK